MASQPKRTTYAINGDAGAFVNIPCTMAAVKVMEIEEVPPVSGAGQGTLSLQGLQYQVWDPSLVATPGAVAGGYGPTQQAAPGEFIVLGDGFTVLGWQAQPANWASAAGRPADVPVKILSGTATATQVQVREYTRKLRD